MQAVSNTVITMFFCMGVFQLVHCNTPSIIESAMEFYILNSVLNRYALQLSNGMCFY